MVVDYYSSNGNLNKYKRGKKGKEYLPIPIVLLEAITGMDVWIFAAALLRQKEEILTSLIAWRLPIYITVRNIFSYPMQTIYLKTVTSTRVGMQLTCSVLYAH